MRVHLSIFVMACLLTQFSWGQQTIGGLPLSLEKNTFLAAGKLTSQNIPAPNLEQLQEEDQLASKQGQPERFAKLVDVDFNLNNAGRWTTLPNGDRVWQMKITTTGAKGINLMYRDFFLPRGATLYLYNEGYETVLGAFTSLNNKESGLFATGNVPGNTLYLEYYEPLAVTGAGRIHIQQVGFVYRHLHHRYLKNSDPCQVDVNCVPEGDDWQDEKAGVVRIAIREGNNQYWCSGSLINNTNKDCIPYILTALHCGLGSTSSDFQQYIFYFNYESSTCGVNDASTSQSIVGCVKRADSGDGGGNNGSDFLLVELTSAIPPSYNAYFNGWNAQNSSSSGGVSIHHPSGDRKKISTYTSNLVSSSWGSTPGTHWRVNWVGTDNGHGVTEGGSSGSPIFDNQGLIVGQLTGGSSYCVTPNSPDQYGKMSYNWDSNPGDDLKVWLDPIGTGTLTLNGSYSPCDGGGEEEPDSLVCLQTIETFPYSEGFETGLGSWKQDSEDDFDWTIFSGATNSNSTGPSGAAEGNSYAYIEASSPNFPNKASLLYSPCFTLPKEDTLTLSFFYHLFGEDEMGGIAVQIRTENKNWAGLWKEEGNLGDEWLLAEIPLDEYLGEKIQLRVIGNTTSTWQGDAAIDGIQIKGSSEEINCDNGVKAFPYVDNFETGLGFWSQDITDDFNWTLQTGRTASSTTGPTSAYEGDYYIYLESSFPNYPNKSAILNSACIDLNDQVDASFQFRYHMYGAESMGMLDVQVSIVGEDWQSLWSITGNQGDGWQLVTIDLADFLDQNIIFRFIGATGDTWRGDIALDDIRVLTTSSQGCSKAILSLDLDNYPEETFWEVTNEEDIVLFSGGTYGNLPDGASVLDSMCLADGCYRFSIYDRYGDGICCAYGQGAYLLQDADGNTIASGASFGAAETTNFCIENGALTESVQSEGDIKRAGIQTKQFRVFPNPTSGPLTVTYQSKASQLVTLKVVDMMGKIIHQFQWHLEAGQNQQSFKELQLANGTYYLWVEEAGQIKSQRFIVID